MSSVIIRPWPFKENEEVELYWLCSPYLSYNKEWILPAVFKKENEIKIVKVPWGTLPLLRLGQRYVNGLPSEKKAKGFVGNVSIENEEFEICSSFDMPAKLYYFYKQQKYGTEKMCRIKIRDREYFIPCIEVIRSFLAKSKTLANYMLKPNGLDFLIDKTEITENGINIFLSNEVPRKIAIEETAVHIVWLKYNKAANEAWNSVYNTIFKKALEASPINPIKALVAGMQLEIKPPINKNCKWNYRGIYNGNSTLILELLGTTNTEMPFINVGYFHPSFDRIKTIDKNGTVRRMDKGKDEIFELPGDKPEGGTKKSKDQSVVELAPTRFIFGEELNVIKLKGKEKKSENGVQVVNAKVDERGKCLGENSIASTQDWSSTGKIEPIEFKSLELVKGKTGKGLEEFYRAIEYIRKYHKELEISMSEVFLPKGRNFSYYPDGSRRNCVIVKIHGKQIKTHYILEIGRADNWSISTLILCHYFHDNMQVNIESLIIKMLNQLINSSGHWNKDLLFKIDKFKVYNLKHSGIYISYQNLAVKIIKKLLY